MNRPNTQEGGTTAIFQGSLKRRLKGIPLVRFSSSAEGTSLAATQNFRLLLKNLSGDLNVQIAAGINATGSGGPIRPNQYPAPGTAFATLQLTPINNFPDANQKVYLRPVFQDPALPQQQNNPLPQDIPFGWEFDSRCDEVEIDVFVTAAGWLNTNVNGLLTVEITIEYNGEWWDAQAISYALSQVTLLGGPTEIAVVNTGGA